MSRPLRIELAGGIYHITSRGNHREDIYLCDSDRRAWLQVLAQVCDRFHWRCHSWCQMDNHYHLVIETIHGNLSQGMRQLNGVYTQLTNRAHGRVGHIFQGRYKAVMVDKENYLLQLARYVVLNPVRAGRVNHAGQWLWSSYAASIGQEPPPPWLEVDSLLAHFGKKRPQAIAQWIDFVHQGIALPSIWNQLRGQIYLGNDAFVQQMQKLSNQPLAEIAHAQRHPMAMPLAHYQALDTTNPKNGMTAAYASGNYTLQAIADAFGVHYATVSRAVRKMVL